MFLLRLVGCYLIDGYHFGQNYDEIPQPEFFGYFGVRIP